MNDYITWYWGWGHFTFGVALFLFGAVVGHFRCKGKIEDAEREKALEVAITNTIENTLDETETG